MFLATPLLICCCCRRRRRSGKHNKGSQFLSCAAVERESELTQALLNGDVDLEAGLNAPPLKSVNLETGLNAPPLKSAKGRAVSPAPSWTLDARAPSPLHAVTDVAGVDGFAVAVAGDRPARKLPATLPCYAVPTKTKTAADAQCNTAPVNIACVDADGYSTVTCGSDRWSGKPWAQDGYETAALWEDRKPGTPFKPKQNKVPAREYVPVAHGCDRFLEAATNEDGFGFFELGAERAPHALIKSRVPKATICSTVIDDAPKTAQLRSPAASMDKNKDKHDTHGKSAAMSTTLIDRVDADADGYATIDHGADRWHGKPWAQDGYEAAALWEPRKPGTPFPHKQNEVARREYEHAALGEDRFQEEALSQDNYQLFALGAERTWPTK